MSMSIFKYELPVAESFMLPGQHEELLVVEVKVPHYSEFLSVAEQHGKPVVWMKVPHSHSTVPMTGRKFVLLATGATLLGDAEDNLRNNFDFAGTLLLNGGHFVLHVFVES